MKKIQVTGRVTACQLFEQPIFPDGERAYTKPEAWLTVETKPPAPRVVVRFDVPFEVGRSLKIGDEFLVTIEAM